MSALTEQFWKDEGDCKLLELGGKWLKEQIDANTIQPRVARWLEIANVPKEYPEVAEEPAAEKQRIFAADAERTWLTQENRVKFERLLETASAKIGDYHQGLGFVASYFSLLLPPNANLALLLKLNEDPKYIPGFWKTAPENYVRDAFVYQRLLQENFPEVSAHLMKFGVVPESYVSKWFVALCVHLLPMEALADYIEAFLEDGYIFLFRFAMSLISAVSSRVLECTMTQIDKVSKLVRLDKTVFPPEEKSAFFVEIVAKARTDFNESVTKEKVDSLREEEMIKLQERLQRAREREAKLREQDEEDEITFSDEEDDE